MCTIWIDVCQNNGNLLATVGRGHGVLIFDKRTSKIVQLFDNIHNSNSFYLPAKSFVTTIYYFIVSINCVRWSPSGDMIASASLDATTVLLDFKTGKKLYTANTSDGSKFSLRR